MIRLSSRFRGRNASVLLAGTVGWSLDGTLKRSRDMGSAIGAVGGYLLVCLIYGQLLPVLCAPTIIAVAIGGVLGQLIIRR